MADDLRKDWREIAAEAANEEDPDKLVALVTELIEVLESASETKSFRRTAGRLD